MRREATVMSMTVASLHSGCLQDVELEQRIFSR